MNTHTAYAAHAEKKKGKKWPWIVGVIATLGIVGSCSTADDAPEDATTTTSSTVVSSTVESVAPEPTDYTDPLAEPEVSEEPANPEETEPLGDVPREYTNALKSAERYLNFSHFSYQGLFDQLTSEYADNFPEDAAQYALDNVEADWNAEAVEAAESYLSFASMSREELYNQLVSGYGEGFTPEQAQYAVDTVY